LQNGVKTLPVGQPSPTLFNLMQMMVQSSQEVSASADLSQALGANAPATTTLALIEEQQAFGGAIILRQYQSMGQEFKKLFILNSKYADPVHYAEVVDDPEANYAEDFNLKNMNIVPTANPEISSKIQRIQLAEVEMSKLEMIVATGGDPQPVVKSFLEMIGSTNVDEIYPGMDPMQELQKLIESNPELAEMLTNEKARNDFMMQAEQDAIEQEQELEAIKGAAEVDKTTAEIKKIEAETRLTLEKAETEDLNNDVSTYTAAANLDKISLENEALNEQTRREGLEEQPSNQSSNG